VTYREKINYRVEHQKKIDLKLHKRTFITMQRQKILCSQTLTLMYHTLYYSISACIYIASVKLLKTKAL